MALSDEQQETAALDAIMKSSFGKNLEKIILRVIADNLTVSVDSDSDGGWTSVNLELRLGDTLISTSRTSSFKVPQ